MLYYYLEYLMLLLNSAGLYENSIKIANAYYFLNVTDRLISNYSLCIGALYKGESGY